ncbi:MAG: putative glycoside hydrolase [Acutalibacteraceae bacterium]
MARKKKTKYDKYFSPGTHSSITAFSKNAAGGSKRRKSYTERRRNRTIGIVVACILGAAVVFTAAFFITDTLMGISDAQVETTAAPAPEQTTQAAGGQTQTETETAPAVSQLKAKTADSSLLSASAELDKYISSLKSSGINAVVIDFKDADGYLYYPSSIAAVQNTTVTSKAQPNAAQAVQKLKSSGISVIARVYCFRDTLMPRTDRSSAVHYSGSQSLWLDNEPTKGGRPWLNPYSQSATNYLTAVVSEVKNLGVDYIMLDGVQFPDLKSNLATFDGENAQGALSRNKVLINFVNSCVTAAGSTPVICTMTGDTAVNGSSQIYDGALWEANASMFAIDVRTLAADAQKKYPASEKIIEIKKTAQSSDTSFILAD